MSIILIHTYQLPLLWPCIRILRIAIHFSGPAPKFMSLEKFAKYFTQPKLESHFIFVKRFVGRAHCLGKKAQNNSTSGNVARSCIFVPCCESRQGLTVCLKRLSLFLRLLYNSGAWSRDVSDWIPYRRKRKDSHTWAQQVSDRMDYGLTVTFPVFKWDHQNFIHTNKSSCFHINIGWSDFLLQNPVLARLFSECGSKA